MTSWKRSGCVPCAGASWASPKSKSLASSVSPARPSVAGGPPTPATACPLCHSAAPGALGSGRALSDAQAEHLQQLVRTHQPEELGIAAPAVEPPCRPRPDPQGIRSRSGGADRRPVSEAPAGASRPSGRAVTPVIKTPKRSGNGWRKPIRPSRRGPTEKGRKSIGVTRSAWPRTNSLREAMRRGGKPRPRMCRTRTSERTKSRRSRTTARFGS